MYLFVFLIFFLFLIFKITNFNKIQIISINVSYEFIKMYSYLEVYLGPMRLFLYDVFYNNI